MKIPNAKKAKKMLEPSMKSSHSTMSINSSNFVMGSVNKGHYKVPSAYKILRNPSGYMIVKPKDHDSSALKDVINEQQYRIDSLLKAERDIVLELDNREHIIKVL
jgi:hypothetical protein